MDEEIIDILAYAQEDMYEHIAYLANHIDNPYPYEKWLNEHNRCVKCGNKLKTVYTYEVHDELEERPIEQVSVGVECPQCGAFFS